MCDTLFMKVAIHNISQSFCQKWDKRHYMVSGISVLYRRSVKDPSLLFKSSVWARQGALTDPSLNNILLMKFYWLYTHNFPYCLNTKTALITKHCTYFLQCILSLSVDFSMISHGGDTDKMLVYGASSPNSALSTSSNVRSSLSVLLKVAMDRRCWDTQSTRIRVIVVSLLSPSHCICW